MNTSPLPNATAELPAWAHNVTVSPESVSLTVHGAEEIRISMRPTELACLVEATRFHGEVAVYSSGASTDGPEQHVVCLAFPDPDDEWAQMPLRYFITGPLEDSATDPEHDPHDYSATNPAYPGHPRAQQARDAVAIRVQSLALRAGLSTEIVDRQSESLCALFASVDGERA